MKKVFVIVVLICQIFLCSCGYGDLNSNQSVLKGKNVIVYGDSIVWGQSGYEPSVSHNPWPSVLAEKTGANVLNMGIPGATMAFVGDDETSDLNRDAFAYLVDSADLEKYDYIFIAYGTNDLSYGVPIGENNDMDTHTFKGAINYSIKRIEEKNPDIHIVLVTPMLDSRLNVSYCDAVIEIAKENDIMAVDMRNIKIEEQDLYDVYWDHATQMHPTESTYYAMGNYMAHFPEFEDVKCFKISYNTGGGIWT